jgi:hypothetical protein
MHPDVLNAKVYALLDDLLRYFRAGEKKDCIRRFGDGFEIRVTRCTLKAIHARVHGVDLIAILFELLVGLVAACLALVRNTDYGNLFLREEILYESVKLGHGKSFLLEPKSTYRIQDNPPSHISRLGGIGTGQEVRLEPGQMGRL